MKNANPLSWLAAAALGCSVLVTTGCGDTEAPVVVEKPATTYFPVKVGQVTAQIQLAVEQAEMARGLMGRRDLGPDQGMLFLYAQPQQMSFWMQNTPTALDIAFFDRNGVLREIYPMYPFDERSVRSRGRDLMYALEMNQGWFSAKGVKVGDHLDLVAVAKALRERGFAGKGIEQVDAPSGK